MKLKLWQVDAFAKRPFEGNPAAIVPLDTWLPDATMQAIAGENNLSETAFFVREGEGRYALRWFTPTTEVDLCGHATLASAHVLFSELAPYLSEIAFSTRSGILTVTRRDDGMLSMSLPADAPTSYSGPDVARALGDALGVAAPEEVHSAKYLFAVWKDAATIRAMTPTGDVAGAIRASGKWALIATAQDDGKHDFVSRFFAPDKGILEDPVTGSAHCTLTPFWAKRLGKKQLRAFQASKRGGELLCTDEGERVSISGNCALYMRGEIAI